MEKFQELDAVAVPIAAPNVDTDQIVPARFLRKPRSGGFVGRHRNETGEVRDAREQRGHGD